MARNQRLFTFEVDSDFERMIRELGAFEERALPYLREWMDRVLFSFRRDQIMVAINIAFDSARGRLAQAKNWKVRKAAGHSIDRLSGWVYIESEAAAAHEFGADLRPKKGRFMAVPNLETKGFLSKTDTLNRSVATPRRAAKRGWKLFFREYEPNKYALFREVGRTKTGKEGKNYRLDLAFFLIRSAKVRPKLGILDRWQKYGPQIESRLVDQVQKFWSDMAEGKRK